MSTTATGNSRYGRRKSGSRSAQATSQPSSRSLPPDIVFNKRIAACARSRQWSHMLKLIEEMKAAGVSPNTITYTTAISALGKCKQWQRALTLFDEMKAARVQPNAITYNALISAMEKGGQ